ncbi:MAG: hypothetical protein QGH93_12525 [Gammaproteobacteria bacterium]|jgi:hypothetical protein|nr:hypothetical protein [Chromatiales bacterium]MDP6675658.1 hypothetical protein [Gammaproteobacteria bacterium]
MPDTTKTALRLCRIFGRLAVALLTAYQPAVADTPVPPAISAALLPAPMDLCTLATDGYLSGDLFGALSENIDWHGADMDCGGMLRPNNDDGIRLVFAAPRQGERLLIVLGIDGQLEELLDGEHTTNITIIDEVHNRFFSTGRQGRCWSTIESIQPVSDSSAEVLQVNGNAYCAGSLPSLSDNSSIALRNLHYSGRLLIDEPDQD